jgi:hypothetical protein
MIRILSTLLALLTASSAFSESRVRRVATKGDQIVTVRTAIGVATIIQVPDRPNSVVVGDQESFRVEYLDQAITIKPLRYGARSNLYVYTDWRRFNVQLVTGDEPHADYVVYLDQPKEKFKITKPSLTWTAFKARFTNSAISFDVKRIGRTNDGVLIIEFLLRGVKRETVRPEWFWLTQGGRTKPIHNLFLSRLSVEPGDPVQGMMQVLKSDIDHNEPLRVEMRRSKLSYLTLPKVASWK